MSSVIQQLASAAKSGRLVPFVGAGISAAQPAGLPLWGEFRDRILSKLHEASVTLGLRELDFASTTFEIKPESVLQTILESTGEAGLLSLLTALEGETPNPNHLILASLCQQKQVRIIITTNFDTLLERALEQVGITWVNFPPHGQPIPIQDDVFLVVAGDEDWAHPGLLHALEARQGPILILKIHGTCGISFGKTRGIVATLKRAAQPLPEWKRSALDCLVLRFRLLVAGYSGNDDDIYPYLLSRKERSPGIYWNFRRIREGVNASRGQVLVREFGRAATPLEFDLDVNAKGEGHLFLELCRALGCTHDIDGVHADRLPTTWPMKWLDTIDQWCSAREALELCELNAGLAEHCGNDGQALRAYALGIEEAEKSDAAAVAAKLRLKLGRLCLSPFLEDGRIGTAGGPDPISNLEQAIFLARGKGLTDIEMVSELILGIALSCGMVGSSNRSADEWSTHVKRSNELADQLVDADKARALFYQASTLGRFSSTPRQLKEGLQNVADLAARAGDIVLKAKALRQLAAERTQRLPLSCSPWAWALLRRLQPEAAAKVADALRDARADELRREISRRLAPLQLASAYDGCWAAELAGKPEDGAEVLRALAARGIPLPLRETQ